MSNNVWTVEVRPVGAAMERHLGGETAMRRKFADIEAECASNQRGHTDIVLIDGDRVRLHVYWNRDIPNKPDGKRDWSR